MSNVGQRKTKEEVKDALKDIASETVSYTHLTLPTKA